MNPREEKLNFTDEQKKALIELKEINEKKIKEIGKELEEYKKKISNFDNDFKKFWDVMKSLEKANSHYPVGHFSNYYYKDFKEPIEESFLSEFGDKNPNFHQITEGEIKDIESKIPNYESYNKIVSETIDNAKDRVKDSLAENIIIRRVVGLPEKYLELQELNNNWWYPKELSQNTYRLGSFVSYDMHLQRVIPYHRQKMIHYDSLFNTTLIVKDKIKEFISILKAINSYLPFAEPIPIEKMPQTYINVETNSIGDSNKFNKDAVIGKNGQIDK